MTGPILRLRAQTLASLHGGMGGMQTVSAWRMPVDVAVSFAVQGGANVQFALEGPVNLNNTRSAQVSVLNGPESHSLSPEVALSTGGTLKLGTDYDASGRAAPSGATSPFSDPKGPDLLSDAVVEPARRLDLVRL